MTREGFYYLAVPYQGSEEEKKFRTEVSLQAAAEFLRQGIHVFAPLIFVNRIADRLNLTSLEKRREVVMPYLLDFLQVSKGLIIITLEGWEKSWGIREEIRFCFEAQIPVYKICPEHLSGDLSPILSAPLSKGEMEAFKDL